MAFCPSCGNLLNGTDPNFCDYCQKAVAGPASESGVDPNNSARGGTEEHDSPGVLHRCPSCGKLFAGEVIDSREIDSSDFLKKDIQPQVHFAHRYRNPTAIAPTDYVYKTTRKLIAANTVNLSGPTTRWIGSSCILEMMTRIVNTGITGISWEFS